MECTWTSPVLLSGHGIEAGGGGVRLWWQVSADALPDGYEIRRTALGQTRLLTPSPPPPCRLCEYVDADPPRRVRVVYSLGVVGHDGPREWTRLGDWWGEPAMPRPVILDPSPHPLRPGGSVRFRLDGSAASVRVELFTLSGRRAAPLADGERAAGEQAIPWNGVDAEGRRPTAGVYLLRLAARPAGGGDAHGSELLDARKILLLP